MSLSLFVTDDQGKVVCDNSPEIQNECAALAQKLHDTSRITGRPLSRIGSSGLSLLLDLTKTGDGDEPFMLAHIFRKLIASAMKDSKFVSVDPYMHPEEIVETLFRMLKFFEDMEQYDHFWKDLYFHVLTDYPDRCDLEFIKVQISREEKKAAFEQAN